MRLVGLAVILIVSLVAMPLVAKGQPGGKPYRIGIVHPGSPPDPWVDAFRGGMQDLGYQAGQNTEFEERWARDNAERLGDSAAELVRLKVVVSCRGMPFNQHRSDTESREQDRRAQPDWASAYD